MAFDENEISKTIDELGPESHGSAAFRLLKTLLKKAKTAQVLAYMTQHCIGPPVSWSEVGAKVWADERERNQNRFPFLQGDVVRSSLVKRLGHSEISVEQRLWLICSPTCDAVRAGFIRVAPLFRVIDENDGTSEEKAKLKVAVTLSSTKRFPIPRFAADDPSIVGYYADFDEPFFIVREDADAAVVLRTLTVRGWHLLNMLLQENETRANHDEERKIREPASTA